MNRDTEALLARVCDPDPLVRSDAADRLGTHGDVDAVPALIDALSDREWRVRTTAARGLERLTDTRAVFPLCRLLDDPKTDVRCAAIHALETLGDNQVTASLIIALDREQDGEAQRLIARALGTIGDDRALPALKRLSGDKHWAVRREATTAIHRILQRHIP